MGDTPATAQTPAPSTPAINETNSSQTPDNVTNKSPETPTQKERRLLETKVNGRTVKVDEDTLLRDYAKYSSANEKFQEAASHRKFVENFLSQLKDNPESVLSDPNLPINKRQLAEKWLMEELEKEMAPQKSEEQRQREAMEKELKKYKDREAEELTAKEQKDREAIIESRKNAIAATFMAAIEASPLSKNPTTQAEAIREMASYLRMCKEAGYDPSPQELADHVSQKYTSSYQTLVGGLDGQDLVDFLGPDIVKRLRKYDLSTIEAKRAAKPAEQADNWQPREDKGKSRAFVDPNKLRMKR